MGDCLWVGKLAHYVTSHPGQLSLAIPPWVGAMSTGDGYGHRYGRQETQLSLTNRATRLEVSQDHQTWYHSICQVWFPITML